MRLGKKAIKWFFYFFWLDSVDLAIERVKTRVQEGGHNIETDVIKRRYKNGIANLFDIYLPIVNEALIFDNTAVKAELIAQKTLGNDIEVINEIKFDKLKNDQSWENTKQQQRHRLRRKL